MVLLEAGRYNDGECIYDSRNSMVLLERQAERREDPIYDSRNSMVLLEDDELSNQG